MTEFKKEWTVESAMEIMQHPTVDSKIWAEAVEWLLLYGPPEVQELLSQSSGHATRESFPDLKPEGFTKDGEPCYNIAAIAKSLGISEEEAAGMVAEKEAKHGIRQLYEEQETTKLQ
ncbi:MAG: hypothetical protein GQ559_01390 [Desulfobulbaceae bacterium]|nr:hypothetical protein [Desulfobulbaceae bacterium]